MTTHSNYTQIGRFALALVVLLWLLELTSVKAQSIQQLEYYFNSPDPGFGNATSLSVNANTGELSQSYSIPTLGLDVGFHTLSLRAQDNNGIWSLYDKEVFYVLEIPTGGGSTLSNLQGLEYWFDAPDPDFGNATALSITGNPDDLTQTFTLPVTGLDVGFHTLSMRSQNQDGVWSLYDKEVFYVLELPASGGNTISNLQSLEYWFDDSDPDFGTATALNITGNPNEFSQTFTLPVSGLDVGFHTLSMRSQNQNGVWSLYDKRVFYVLELPTGDNSISPLAEAEFLYDAELGFGTGTAAVLTPTANPDEYIVEIPTDMVTCDMHDIWLSVKNDAGNYSLYQILLDVDVFDNAPPTIVPYDNITVVLDENGEGSLMIDEVDNGTFDDCTLVSVELPQPQMNYTCADLGANTVTVTAIDAENKVSTLDVPFTVIDNIDPVAVANTFTVQLDANGEATVNAADLDGGSTDNCGIEAFSLDISTFDCSNLGDNAVVFTVTDASGNSNSTNATISVVENEPPVVVTQDITVQLDASGNASISETDIDNGSTDNCGVAGLSLDISTFDCTNLGDNTVTLSVTDNNGNTATGTAIVTVEDTIDPSVTTQDITVQLDVNGNATITPAMVEASSADNCSVASSSLDQTTFTCDDSGTNTVTLTVTDTSGNTSFATAIVTVVETVPPVAISQNFTAQLGVDGTVTVTPEQVDGGSTDNCGIVSSSLDISVFTCDDLGDNTVTLTVTDGSGNSDSATAIVTVQEVATPTAIAQDITVQLDANGEATITAAMIDNGSTTSCGVTNISIDQTDFDCSDIGPNTVTLTVEDASGNSSTATAVVTVEDTTAPNVVVQDLTLQLDANGNASISVSDVDNGTTDNCGINSSTLDTTKFDCSDIGVNIVTLTVEDVNGNTGTATANITIEENEAPIAIAQDIIVELDAVGEANLTVDMIDNGSTDNCGIVSSSIDITKFDCSDIGVNVVTLTVVDASGNSSTATANVTVQDNLAPIVVAQDINVQLDASGNTSILLSDIENGSTDNCGIATSSLDISSFDCTDVGDNVVTLSVTDVNGNVGTAAAVVMVEDNTNPTAVAQDISIALDANGQAVITAADVDNGSSDNCAIATSVLDISTFDCSHVGDNTVILTITDSSGNESTATATVSVEDNSDPVVVTQDITIQLDSSGNATITPSDIDNGSGDNCGIATSVLDITSFTTSNLGPNTVTLTITDTNGNTSTATAVVTVEEFPAVNVITQDITVQLDANGVAVITPEMIDNGSTTCCGNTGLSLDITNFDCSNLGANTVTLTVTDGIGNTNSGTAVVTVVDGIDPIALTQDITVSLDTNGQASISASDIENGSSDNCGIASSTLDISNFDCSNLGDNIVTLTVQDADGNESSTTAVVTVVDDLDPVAVTQDISVSLDVNGQASISASDIDNGSSDNCGIASSTLDISSFDCSDLGTNLVTLTVTDASDNSNSATAVVTVSEAENPVAVTQDITVSLDANGQASISASDIDNGSSDNCGITSSTLDISSFDCSNIGDNTVTLTVQDASGNSSSATATVAVIDDLDPVVFTQDISVSLDVNGQASISASDIENGSSDNCEIVSSSLDVSSFDCSNLGENTVTLTVQDAEGNESSATAIVTVVDDIDPVAVTQDISVSLDANGQASISASDIENGSSDNCGIVSSTLDISTFDCSDLGNNSVTLTVQDLDGNESSATAVVTVVDDLDPVAFTQDISVSLDVNGQASISAGDIDNGSSDNCSVSNLSLDVSIFDCSNLGDNTVTLTVQDAEGNESSATAVVTVVDDLEPVAITQDISVSLDDNGQASISASDIDNGSSDNCAIVSSTLDVSTFDCSDIGTNLVTLTVADASGNTNSATAVVTISEAENPVAVTQDISVSLDANGQASISASDIDNGSSDNCGIVSSTLDVSTFDCSDVGVNTVTLTVTDASGNESSATAIVTVVDDTNPIAVTQDITVQLDANGQATISATDVDNGSSDNCGIVSSTHDINSFDCSDLGTNSVTLTVTDASGNSSTATAVVTVEDDTNPVAVTQDITVELDVNGQATISASDVDNGSGDNCSVASLTLDITAFDCSDLGDNTVTLTVQDADGNESSATAVVTVVDNLDPIALSQDITVQLDDNGFASISDAVIDNGSSDNCGIVSSTLDVSTFDCSDVGDNTVTLTVTDASGNSSSATAVVTVEDVSDPIAVTQDITVQLDANGQVSISATDIDNGSSDNCGIVSSTLDVNSFDCSDLGTNLVTLSVTDASGNSSTATAVVTVEDDTNPVAITQDITVELDTNGQATISANDIDNGSGDNCSVSSLMLDITSFDCSDLGDNTVTLTVQDADGNESSATAVVTVVDNLAPVAVAQDISVSLDANGQASISDADIDNGSSDNCGIVSSTLDVSTFDCSDVGDNTITLTVTDASGNSSSATAIVTVVDDTNPIAVTQDITVQLDASGQATISATDIDNGSSDNCGIVSSTLDVSTFDCSDLGTNSVTLTVTDASGNSSSTTAVVTVEDDTNPIAVTQDITVELDANGQATISASDLDNGSGDNCSVASLSLDITSFDCSDIGDNTVTLTVQDIDGNESSSTAVVTVVDNLNPVALAQDITVQLDANGQASISASDIDNGSSDNCGITSSTLDISSFDCSNIGDNTVTLTVQDSSGNSSSATAVVTVVDDLNPLAIAQDITVQLDANGQVSISASDIDNGSSDNCGIVSSTLDASTFDCSDLGTNSVTLTITDASGNSSTATAVITVEDDTNPVAVTQDITVELDANGQASISASDVDNGSGDNCSVASLTLDITAFDCSDLGDNTVTLTVQDIDGNESSATAVVTVVDNLAPVAIAQDITVQLDANGVASISDADIDNGSSDNCGIVSSTLDVSSFDCSNIGANTVTLTVTDASGNSSSVTAIVAIVEDVNPIAVAQDITVELDVNGQVSVSGSDVNNGSSDNCGITNLYLDVSSFDCDDIGDNTVLFTVEDGSGNTDSVSVVVTVEDNLAPTAIGQDITIDLAGNPSVSILPEDVNNASFDNCSDVTLSIDEDTFTTIGDFPVILTVEDELGNISSVTVIVTVEDTMGVVDNEIRKVEITVYPSPAEKLLYFETNTNILSYSIYDLFGKTVIDKTNANDQVNIELLADGVYLIKFKLYDDHFVIRKFVKR